ncbi:5-formyltetrahydrofolate cyclo-ligase [Aeromicrobium sp. Sec7.5]|uniref:5-formyltetrahydrofolate cyclo-ligase n=1 Tax=Aeromicrobium sp. Sec7.5 TaxID=3121276 RepID=UPI002FE43304
MGHTSGAKDDLRRTLLAARRRRSEPDLLAVGAALAAHVAGDPALHGARHLAAYLAMRGEPPTDALVADRLAAGATVLVPLSRDDGGLDWVVHDPASDVRRSTIGVPEPVGLPTLEAGLATTQLVLVPALAVDHQGHRLGRGAGYYDRALASLRDRARRPMTCAVVFADELVPAVPTEAHDVPVDLVLTEAGVFRPAR